MTSSHPEYSGAGAGHQDWVVVFVPAPGPGSKHQHRVLVVFVLKLHPLVTGTFQYQETAGLLYVLAALALLAVPPATRYQLLIKLICVTR